MRWLLALVGVIVLTRLLLAATGGAGSFTAPPSTYYGLINGKTLTDAYAIGAVTRAPDGTWSEYASNPVLTKGSSGAWDDEHVKDPCLLWDGSQYVMYYSGQDGTTFQIGRATAASHEGPWTKYASNPVLTVGAGGTWDDAGVTFAAVLYEPDDTGREWKMWYTGNDGTTLKIGYAYSSDGLSWTKYASNPVVTVGTSGAWDDEGVGLGTVNNIGGTYYMQISGRQGTTNPRWQGGLVTFTDPEGTYTKHASNPFLRARFNDTGTSPAPTADVMDGATTVALADTSPFNVGEPIAIADGDTTAHIGYIASIDSGTQVTLDRAVVGDFTGGGKVFRSFATNSTALRTVIHLNDGSYLGFGSAFQPVEDLTQPASKLWEGSFEWTAPDLTTNWTYRYVAGRGLLFPLVVGEAWHTRSAENPSIIVAP